MPGYYNTMPAQGAGVEKAANLTYIALGCVLFGAATAFVASMTQTSSLYASIGTKPMVQTAAPISIPARQAYGSRISGVQAAAQQGPMQSSFSEESILATPMGAVFGGFAIAAAATIAAVATKMFRRGEASSILSKYQLAEAQWSMAAATAFVGTQAPDFKATAVYDQEFVEVQLSQYRGKKYVVLFFYPLDFTFVCPTEITAFSDRAAEFEAIDTQILGVSVDSQFSHLAWVQTPRNEGGLGEITYPLVADLKKEIAETYGVLTEEGVALRGLFIIDKEGIIQHATINNLAFGRNVDETLRVLEAVQHVQANPDEVCPAGWKKGDKTMKPDPEGSKEYFSAI